jgi:anti-sigma regulatory factor (Ser/Thr protein kinase)
MRAEFRLTIKNLLEEIPPATELAAGWLVSRGVTEHHTHFARLVIDEVVSNCVKYGYPDSSLHHIEIELAHDGENIRVAIIDDGHPFNPLEHPEPDTSLPVEQRDIGGLGIHLLRKMADRIQYERIDGRNRLTLLKSTNPPSQP